MKYEKKYQSLPRIGAAEVGRPVFRHSNPLKGGQLYIFEQPLYDVYIVGANTVVNSQVLFASAQGQSFTPPGGAAFIKTKFHTWLTQNGQLSAPQKHVARGVSISFKGTITPNDINRMLSHTLLTFRVDQMDFLTIQLQKIGGGGGPYSGAAASIVSNGWPTTNNMFLLDPSGETIEQQQNFAVTLDPTKFDDGIGAAGGSGPGAFTTDATTTSPAGTGILGMLFLDGQLARAVQ